MASERLAVADFEAGFPVEGLTDFCGVPAFTDENDIDGFGLKKQFHLRIRGDFVGGIAGQFEDVVDAGFVSTVSVAKPCRPEFECVVSSFSLRDRVPGGVSDGLFR